MEMRQVSHTWRTREDPVEAIWPLAAGSYDVMRGSGTGGKAFFDHLTNDRGDEIKPGLLRTFQRRVKCLRLTEEPEKEVFFYSGSPVGKNSGGGLGGHERLGDHHPGQGLWHKLFDGVLPFLNWEWAVRFYSESALSLRGGRRKENNNGNLKRRVRQHLLLRGSRDFASEEEYDGFLIKVLELADRLGVQRLTEELAAIGERPPGELADYRVRMAFGSGVSFEQNDVSRSPAGTHDSPWFAR